MLIPRLHRMSNSYRSWASSLIFFVGGFLLAHLRLQYNGSSKTRLEHPSSSGANVSPPSCPLSLDEKELLIISSHSSGRLGNRMSEYASIVALGALRGYTPVMSQRLQKSLVQIFPYIPYYQAVPLSIECMADLVSVNPTNQRQLEQAMNRSTRAWPRPAKGIKLVRNPHIPELYGLVSGILAAHFTFEPQLYMAAQTWLLQRHADLQSQLFEWVNPIWIGLHVRRTDYERVLSRRNASLVELEYFERAIREMKAIILGAEIAQHSKMVFVVASDDPAWCMQQLPRIPGEKFIFTNENDAIHIQDNGLESDFQVAFDLCVMSLCNHSIYDYGTFAFWGAYLSGGFVVAAAMDVVEEQQPQGGLGDLGNRVRMATDVMRADRNANLSRWHFIPAHLTPVTVLK